LKKKSFFIFDVLLKKKNFKVLKITKKRDPNIKK